MKIKKHIKNILGVAFVLSGLASGSANAESISYTGLVSNTFTMYDDYTFATVAGHSGYYIGPNSAIATKLDNAKRLNQEITIYVDSTTGVITLVQ